MECTTEGASPTLELGVSNTGAEGARRKRYQHPALVKWGSLRELTLGPTPIGTDDADFVSSSFGT